MFRNKWFEGTTNLNNVEGRTRVTLYAVNTGILVLRNRIFETGKWIFRSIYGVKRQERDRGIQENARAEKRVRLQRGGKPFEDWERGRVVKRSRERETSFLRNNLSTSVEILFVWARDLITLTSARKSEERRGIAKSLWIIDFMVGVWKEEVWMVMSVAVVILKLWRL